jgi:hypothetical protein
MKQIKYFLKNPFIMSPTQSFVGNETVDESTASSLQKPSDEELTHKEIRRLSHKDASDANKREGVATRDPKGAVFYLLFESLVFC